MKKSKIIRAYKEVVQELSATGGGASFTTGKGMQTATPVSFKKRKNRRER